MIMKNKVIIITGASSGIGKALALELGNLEAKIVITGRRKEALDTVEQELRQKNIEVLSIVADSAIEEDNQRIINETIKKFQKIDILINNAGISMRALFEDTKIEVIKQIMDINFYGMVYATKYALPYILESKGSIVGISSINGYRGTPARTGYTASKFAMNGFLEALRTEVMKRDVHILVACPGFTASNIRKYALDQNGNPQGESPREEQKMMSAETVAKKIINAIQKRKRDLILTRQGKLAVFLNKWLPKMMDKIVYNVMKKEPNSPLK
ncbi:MAG: SDR family oxidoreductase [Cytophagia bacterium]|nr:MAG: SDR family oxidoreductase [Cytophagia bacterium]TAG42116.1 MAG: SDR family oxidoreductase [Cytophagia bacterium]TAG50929.1 MAG: SDR family oxidoreductase [Cytophagales bacterium]TAH28467.1 MAG: SDR family oxidoreductase [Cytophagales bacterium]